MHLVARRGAHDRGPAEQVRLARRRAAVRRGPGGVPGHHAVAARAWRNARRASCARASCRWRRPIPRSRAGSRVWNRCLATSEPTRRTGARVRRAVDPARPVTFDARGFPCYTYIFVVGSHCLAAMTNYPVHVNFPGRLVIVGFGSIGQGVLPLILRHVGITTDRITIVTADDARRAESRRVRHPLHQAVAHARELQARARSAGRTRRFPAEPVGRRVEHRADQALLGQGALYLDTCIEPWPGGYTDPTISPSRSAPTTPCVRRRSRCARPSCRARPPCSRTAPIPGSSRTSSSRRCSTSPRDTRRRRRQARVARGLGRSWRRSSASRSSTSPSATRRCDSAPKEPGRVRQHLVGRRLRRARARSRPNSAGARTRRTGRATARGTISAAAARST